MFVLGCKFVGIFSAVLGIARFYVCFHVNKLLINIFKALIVTETVEELRLYCSLSEVTLEQLVFVTPFSLS